MFELSFYAPIDVRHNYQQSPADVLKKRRPEKFIEFSENTRVGVVFLVKQTCNL